jgi:hypothetical protein
VNIEVLLVQFLVLVFTGVVWWLARRDLASRPAPPLLAAPEADTRELEQLCATLETLVTDLAGRLEVLEQRLQEGVGARFIAPSSPPSPSEQVRNEPEQVRNEEGAMNRAPTGPFCPSSPPSTVVEPEIASHASLYALLDEGVTDPAEIARRTGLGRGEVDLILSLRARRAL